MAQVEVEDAQAELTQVFQIVSESRTTILIVFALLVFFIFIFLVVF